MIQTLKRPTNYIYLRRNETGTIVAAEEVDGKTIARIVDYYGNIPKPPVPAYQQIIQNQPWVFLTSDELIPLVNQ